MSAHPNGPLVIATFNAKKAVEMATILSNRFPGLEVRTLADFPGAPEPEETGTTYRENAAIKAISAAEFTRKICVADDAGLEIDALGGEPGLFSRRFAGEETPFPEKMAIILDRMKDLADGERTARFRCVVAVARADSAGEILVDEFDATCEGRIAREMKGHGGFGYDPIFLPDDATCAMAELSPEEKQAISHRGKVLRLVGDFLAPIGVSEGTRVG
jgi:XTP/dITP diphosphohydrolase